MEIDEQKKTFEGFMVATKYGLIACVVVLALMAFFLT